MTNPKIHLTYEEALATAEGHARALPDKVAEAAYFNEHGNPECLVSNILAVHGFNPGPEWWDSPRGDLPAWSTTKTIRRNVHIRFLASEMFSNEDVMRDALLVRLQVGNDSYKDRRWAAILRRAKSYMGLLTARGEHVKELASV